MDTSAQTCDTPTSEVADVIDRVSSKAGEWATLPASSKREIFEECFSLLKNNVDQLITASCISRGYDPSNETHGHLVADATILSCVLTSAWVRGAIDFFAAIETTGKPPQGSKSTPRPDGTHRVKVFPSCLFDSVLADTGKWLAVPLGEGGAFEVVVRGDKVEQFDPLSAGASVVGVLGAGNTEILNDIIDPLCKQNAVVVYKSNPVLAISNRVKETILKPLISRGYVGFVYGGPDVGKLIVESPKIDRIVMTGAAATFDKIVWGDRDKTDPSSKPIVQKTVLAELGSVNPYIVVPGETAWTDADLDYQAEALVATKLVNNGHVCAAPQVLVTCRSWPQREAFLSAIRKRFACAPSTCCFYPGTEQKYNKHSTTMGAECEVFMPTDGGSLSDRMKAPIFETGLGVSSELKLACCDEAFGPVLYEVTIPSETGFTDFLPKAIEFCHSNCWGSLTCTLIVDDNLMYKHKDALDAAIDSMRFGVISVNFPVSGANAFPVLSWGAFPRHDQRDVQSGLGHLGNFCCYKNLEKSIIWNRFKNLHSFKLASTPAQKSFAKVRARRLAEVFCHWNCYRLVKFAAAEFLGI